MTADQEMHLLLDGVCEQIRANQIGIKELVEDNLIEPQTRILYELLVTEMRRLAFR